MKKTSWLLTTFFLLTICGCSTKPAIENRPSDDNFSSSARQSSVAVLTNPSWTTVDRQTDWPADYNFPPISFAYPSQWTFHCCGDMDEASQHTICANDACDSYVKITDYSLRGCPEGKSICAMEDQELKTAQQKYDELTKSIELTDAQILHVDAAPGLRKDAFVYEAGDHARTYLLNLDSNVIGVTFSQDLVMKDAFMTDFLTRMIWDRN